MRHGIFCILVACALTAGCEAKDKGVTPSGTASAGPDTPAFSPSSSSVASASAAPSSSAAPVASGSASNAAPMAAASFAGKYKSAASPLYVPTDAPNGKDWAAFKWKGDDAKEGLGDGDLSLAIDAEGKVVGALEGPLGPGIVEGSASAGQVTATIRRKNIEDRGFEGTISAKLAADKIDGSMNLALLPNSNVIRSATFSLAKK